MPPLSRCFLKTALIYLLLGITLGSTLLADKSFGFADWLWVLRPLHIEWLLIGWFLQLAFGVATWMLPRLEKNENESIAGWTSYTLLNIGLSISAIGLMLSTWGDVSEVAWTGLIAAILEIGSVIFFVKSIWRRVSYISPTER